LKKGGGEREDAGKAMVKKQKGLIYITPEQKHKSEGTSGRKKTDSYEIPGGKEKALEGVVGA